MNTVQTLFVSCFDVVVVVFFDKIIIFFSQHKLLLIDLHIPALQHLSCTHLHIAVITCTPN